MKRFVWRLQQVLDIRAKEEETKRAELLKIAEKLAETRRELLERQTILKNIISGIAVEQPRKRLAEQEFFLRHSMTSDEQIKKLKDKIGELECKYREKIGELIKAKRLREGLERLRAEAKRKFISEQERLEQKELDEMAGIFFVRKAVPIFQGGRGRR